MRCSRFQVVLVIAAVGMATLILANSANAALVDEDFQTPLLGNGTQSPGFAGWTYNDGNAVRSRREDNQSDIPGDTDVVFPNQALQLEWVSGEAKYDTGHTWSAGDVFTLTFNASPQAWNLDNPRWVRPSIYQTGDNAVLWAPGEDATTAMPHPPGYVWNGPGLYGDSDWQSNPGSVHSFTINASDFTAGAEGSAISLKLDHSGQRGMYYDNVLLELGTAPGPVPVVIPVPNGSFEEMYKPGTAIPGVVSSGGWTQGVGPDCPIDSGQYEFSDASTGDMADIAGWIGADRDGWIANGGTYGRDQTTGNLQGSVARQTAAPDGVHYYLSNGGGWGNPAGGLIVSDAPLATVEAGATYTLSMLANGSATPIVLELLAGGVMVTPSSLVDPTLSGAWQEFSRTYDPASLAGFVGDDLTILLGVGRGASGTQSHFDSVGLTVLRADIIPEPATLSLLGLGALLALRRRRRSR